MVLGIWALLGMENTSLEQLCHHEQSSHNLCSYPHPGTLLVYRNLLLNTDLQHGPFPLIPHAGADSLLPILVADSWQTSRTEPSPPHSETGLSPGLSCYLKGLNPLKLPNSLVKNKNNDGAVCLLRVLGVGHQAKWFNNNLLFLYFLCPISEARRLNPIWYIDNSIEWWNNLSLAHSL